MSLHAVRGGSRIFSRGGGAGFQKKIEILSTFLLGQIDILSSPKSLWISQNSTKGDPLGQQEVKSPQSAGARSARIAFDSSLFNDIRAQMLSIVSQLLVMVYGESFI